MSNKKLIYFPTPTVNKETIVFHGAGTFGEEKLILNREQAALAYIELHKFLLNKTNDPKLN